MGISRSVEIVTALAFGMSGCSPLFPAAEPPPTSYFAVKYELRGPPAPVPIEEVVSSQEFVERSPAWRVAAVRAPNYCSDRAGTEPRRIQGCMRVLAEIERNLVASRLVVVSWSTLHDTERTQQRESYVAARDLGAQVVLVVNDLEDELVPFGDAPYEALGLTEADENGHSLGGMTLDAEHFEDLRRKTRRETESLRTATRGSTAHLVQRLDITAVDTETGKAIWFYRRSLSEPLRAVEYRHFLFATSNGRQWPVWPRAMRDEAEAERDRPRSGGFLSPEPDRWSRPSEPANVEAKAHVLMSRVVADFSRRLRGGV